MKCHHGMYHDVGGFEFGQTETVVDGMRYVQPVMKEPPPFDIDAPLAVWKFFDSRSCPVCEGATTCPDCGESL